MIFQKVLIVASRKSLLVFHIKEKYVVLSFGKMVCKYHYCSTVLMKYVLFIAFKNTRFVRTDVFRHAFYDI